MFHDSLRVIDEPKMSDIRIQNLCHKESILVDIYRQSLLIPFEVVFPNGSTSHSHMQLWGKRMFQEFLVLFEDFRLNNHSLEFQFPQLVRCHSKPPHSLFPATHFHLQISIIDSRQTFLGTSSMVETGQASFLGIISLI